MKRICVYCGSSNGAKKEYAKAARGLGSLMGKRGIGLVFGGGNVGLMNEVANAVLSEGGEVIGIIPRALNDMEVAHAGLTELKIVPTMHERKAMMAERSDAFIALPGGIGTLEELLEAMTWTQLGIHRKPCGLLNVLGYYDPLIELLNRAVAEGFLKPGHNEMLVRAEQPEELLDRLQRCTFPKTVKYTDLKID